MSTLKVVKSVTSSFIEFSEEEIAEAGWKPNQRLEMTMEDDGALKIVPWKSVDIGDISDYPREVLELFVLESLEKDVPVTDIINDVLKAFVDEKYIDAGAIDPDSTNTDTGIVGGTSI